MGIPYMHAVLIKVYIRIGKEKIHLIFKAVIKPLRAWQYIHSLALFVNY